MLPAIFWLGNIVFRIQHKKLPRIGFQGVCLKDTAPFEPHPLFVRLETNDIQGRVQQVLCNRSMMMQRVASSSYYLQLQANKNIRRRDRLDTTVRPTY